MKKETIRKIVTSILNKDIDFEVDRFHYEETKGFYKNIYKIITKRKTYVLKASKGDEEVIYKLLNNEVNSVPYYYGSYKYRNKIYTLVDFVNGKNAMKLDRKNLVKIIDAIIDVQNRFWNSNLTVGTSFDNALGVRENRLTFLPDELKSAYQKYIDCFKAAHLTFSHEDLLPFNVLINKSQAYFIDFEVAGILPYPTMLARLIAHGEENKNALFFLRKQDYKFAVEYYYENFIKDKGITKEEYLRTMKLFVYNELIEWVYVYNKNNYEHNEFYGKYYTKALQLSIELF